MIPIQEVLNLSYRPQLDTNPLPREGDEIQPVAVMRHILKGDVCHVLVPLYIRILIINGNNNDYSSSTLFVLTGTTDMSSG